jgi:hypothetical protein
VSDLRAVSDLRTDVMKFFTRRRNLAALLVLAAIYAASPRTVFCGSIYGGPVFGATWGSGKPPFTVALIHNRYHTAVGCYLTN